MKPVLKGSLAQKVHKAREVDAKIRRTRGRGIRESSSLDDFLSERENLEADIRRHLMNGERVANPLLDYCFRHFPGGSHTEGADDRKVYTSTFEKVPLVREFVGYIRKKRKERIFVVPGFNIGVISGRCEFRIKNTFRNLYVLVKQSLHLSHGRKKWVKGKSAILIPDDIFGYPSAIKLFEGIWESDHSGEKVVYVGGGPPPETVVYVGDENVERGIRAYSEIKDKILADSLRIPTPPP